ncbi:MAG: protein kinase [bacterium]
MPLVPGTRLGPYEIVAPLGAGGMGEVYRARDTRLGRDVAIKALPDLFAQDPERLARFEREARLLASLSHPNIAGIHGLEVVEGHRYLALEFVEGETLAARLARGALPIEEAIDVCRQIAAGVEAAHESGVVHRDLKPGNVMLTPSGAVKVLDFGLAKSGVAGASSAGAALSASPTLTHAATGAGVILGTAAYMSPEQARGKVVDRRTDVWSFGCVLYECVTGRQAYEAETVSDVIARILEREPDWSALPPTTPPRVVELLRRCLTKDATLRLRDIGEARVALAEPGAVAGAADGARARGRTRRRWITPALAAALAVAVTASAWVVFRSAHPHGPVRRFRVPVEGLTTTFFTPLALTHDGSRIAYEAKDRVWIRRLDQIDALEVPDSKGGRAPFWSWDQNTLGFAANKKLWTFAPGASQCTAICDIPESGEILGAAWSPDARIVLAVWRGGIYEVSATGGDVRSVLAPDSSTVDFHGPSYLPDGRTLLVFVHDKGNRSAVATLEGSPPRLERVFEDARAGTASYSPTGHLLVTREESRYRSRTWAVPFSAAQRKVTGPAFTVLDGAEYACSASNGLLVAAEDEPPPPGQLVWVRRGGGEESIGEPQPGLSTPALSPDGGRVAYAVQDANADIWVQDLARGTRTRLTSSPEWEGNPAWSPDGSRIYYCAVQSVGTDRIVAIASDGSGSPDTLCRGLQASPSPDGKTLVCTVDRRGNADLWIVRLDRANASQPFLDTPSNEAGGTISPDGRWIAYTSDESGRNEIYIRRYPEGDERAQVSVGGGNWPRWSRRGDAIYYANRDSVSTVSVGAGPRPVLGLPRALFASRAQDLELSARDYAGFPLDPHPDGIRFIGVRRTASPATRTMIFVENWFEDFRKR